MSQNNTSVQDEEKDNEPSDDAVEILDAENASEEKDENETSEEIAALKKEKDEIYDRYLRVQAEYDNYKRRTEKEKVSERKYKALDIASDIIPVLDNFERALQVEITEENEGIVEGITMVYNQLIEALNNNGVEEMEVEGQTFDPNLHHAVDQAEEEDVESNIVVEELQKGYLLKDKVIRPAMVKVNK